MKYLVLTLAIFLTGCNRPPEEDPIKKYIRLKEACVAASGTLSIQDVVKQGTRGHTWSERQFFCTIDGNKIKVN